jgi:hypothetical protein
LKTLKALFGLLAGGGALMNIIATLLYSELWVESLVADANSVIETAGEAEHDYTNIMGWAIGLTFILVPIFGVMIDKVSAHILIPSLFGVHGIMACIIFYGTQN